MISETLNQQLKTILATPHRYGMRGQRIGPYRQPPGFIDYEPADKTETGFYGILTYGQELSQEQMERYELTPLPN